jgi:hypothetical protein
MNDAENDKVDDDEEASSTPPTVMEQFAQWVEGGLTPAQARILCRHDFGGAGNILIVGRNGYCWSFARSEEDDDQGESVIPLSDVELAAVRELCKMDLLEEVGEGFFVDGPKRFPEETEEG